MSRDTIINRIHNDRSTLDELQRNLTEVVELCIENDRFDSGEDFVVEFKSINT